MKKNNSYYFTSILSLFFSSSTLVCCALPVLLTSIGLTSVLLGLVSNSPFLVTLTQYKDILFVISFFLILLNFILVFKRKVSVCEVNKGNDDTPCKQGTQFSKIMFFITLGIYIIGGSFAYILPFFLV